MSLRSQLCSTALIFIMFYGGFGTKWNAAKPVAVQSFLLSTAGVVFTAVFTALFCRFVLHISASESFLIGAVISSTDAASVFYILRSKKLNLKNNTASLLEAESGSNDPGGIGIKIFLQPLRCNRTKNGLPQRQAFGVAFIIACEAGAGSQTACFSSGKPH